MEVEYDRESDAAFLWLIPPPEEKVIESELWPPELKEHIGLLFDSEQRLIGVEILFASAYLPKELLKSLREANA
jgi:uncharacterized protein YuzE